MSDFEKKEIIESLKKFVCEKCLKKPEFELDSDEPLMSSGLLTSIHLVELAVFIEKEFEIYVPDTEFTTKDVDTLDAIAEAVLRYRE